MFIPETNTTLHISYTLIMKKETGVFKAVGAKRGWD